MYACNKVGYEIRKENISIILKIILSSCIMGMIIIFLYNINTFIVISIAIFVYFFILYILKVFDKADLLIFTSVIYKT
jgi:hypothetical protein